MPIVHTQILEWVVLFWQNLGLLQKKYDKAIFYFILDFTEKFTLVAMLKIVATG